MKRPLFTFAVLFLGSLAVIQLWGGFSGFLAAGGALLVSVCLPREKQKLGRQLLLCGAAASVAAMAVFSGFHLRLEARRQLEGQRISFTGWLEETSPYNPARVTLRGRAVWEDGAGSVHLTFQGMTEETPPGQWLAGEFLVAEAREDGAVPGGVALLVRGSEAPEPIPAPDGFHPLAELAALRWRISQRLWEVRPGEDTGVLLALVFSLRDKLPEQRLAELDQAGLRHLLVVSGLHLSLLIGWLEAVCRRLGLGQRAGSLLCLFGVWFLAGLAGFSVSVLRAGIMTTLYLLGRLVFRRPDSLTSLGLSGLILGALTPPALFTVSWQLTFSATLGLLLGAGTLSDLAESRLVGRFGGIGRGSRWVVEGLTASVGAQLGALPVLAAQFGRFTLWGLVTTLPAIPLVTGAILLGGAGALCFSFPALEAMGLPLLDTARFFARLLLLLAKGTARLGDLSFPVLLPWQLALCALIPVAVFFCLALLPHLSRRQGRPLLWGSFSLVVLSLGSLWVSTHNKTILSLGESGAVVVAAPAGTVVLDAGESAWDRWELSNHLLRTGEQRPLVMAFSQTASANAVLGLQRDLSPAAVYLPGEEIPILENQFPGNFLPLGTERQEVLPGILLSCPAPGCLLVETEGRKVLKSSAPYAIIKEFPQLEEADLVVSRSGQAFSGPGMPKPARMPTGDRNLMVRTVLP